MRASAACQRASGIWDYGKFGLPACLIQSRPGFHSVSSDTRNTPNRSDSEQILIRMKPPLSVLLHFTLIRLVAMCDQ